MLQEDGWTGSGLPEQKNGFQKIGSELPGEKDFQEVGEPVMGPGLCGQRKGFQAIRVSSGEESFVEKQLGLPEETTSFQEIRVAGEDERLSRDCEEVEFFFRVRSSSASRGERFSRGLHVNRKGSGEIA